MTLVSTGKGPEINKKKKKHKTPSVVLERVLIKKRPYLLLFQKAWVSFPAPSLGGSAPGDLTT